MNTFRKGDFVWVGKDIGVVVFLEKESETPEDHLGIWYGETDNEGIPRYRTVPVEYCERIKNVEEYH